MNDRTQMPIRWRCSRPTRRRTSCCRTAKRAEQRRAAHGSPLGAGQHFSARDRRACRPATFAGAMGDPHAMVILIANAWAFGGEGRTTTPIPLPDHARERRGSSAPRRRGAEERPGRRSRGRQYRQAKRGIGTPEQEYTFRTSPSRLSTPTTNAVSLRTWLRHRASSRCTP